MEDSTLDLLEAHTEETPANLPEVMSALADLVTSLKV